MSPPLLFTALAPERRTYGLVKESGYLTVNLLGFSRAEPLALVGDVSARFAPEKFEKAGIYRRQRVPSVAVEGAAAVVECSLHAVLDIGGDRDVFIGRAEAVYASDDFTEGGWKLETHKPIL